MKREQVLRRRLRSEETLSEAVTAMKSLSAHHFRMARRAVQPAREYRQGVDRAIDALAFSLPVAPAGVPAVLAVTADRGLCGSYTAQVTRKVIEESARYGFGKTFCIGRRGVAHLSRGGLTVSQVYPAPASLSGVTRLLLDAGGHLMREYLEGEISSVDVVYARFGGVGNFNPVSVRVLPVTSAGRGGPERISDYVSPGHVAAVALRELLHCTLYEILIDALASEHGARLAATEAAQEWLDDRMTATRRQLAAVHREASTQEVLDIAAGARQRLSRL
ncbi:MAG TPA: F0F1 ATP synthase subunit gamma [Terriglobia bacterium]|nr:F0F1 ATP synthase subunit gamma [Terriglobia bacterium]